MRLTSCLTLISAIFLTLPADPARAADGVIEINQTCAVETGCPNSAVDKPGFPVTIGSGSYVLTSDLVVPPEVNAISTEDFNDPGAFPETVEVSIDLNGFQISSTTTCTIGPTVCTPSNLLSGYGIVILGTGDLTRQGLGRVHNGIIRGMAGIGAFCSGSCVISDLVVSDVGITGIASNSGSISNVSVRSCATGGIQSNGTVENSLSQTNGYAGIFGSGTFRGNTVLDNDGHGILGNSGTVVAQNQIHGSPVGLRCAACTAHGNRITATTTGIDFQSQPALFGGNAIDGATQDLLNDGSAVQDGVNLCGGAACP